MVKKTSHHVVYTSGGMVALLCCLCMLTWIMEHGSLLQLSVGFQPMSFNTALCHFLCGAALVTSLHHKMLSLFCAISAALISSAIGWQYITGTASGIDNFFVAYDMPTKSPYPGRLAPNSVLSFQLFSASIICWHLIRSRSRRIFALILLGVLALLFSIVTLFGHILGVEAIYRWGSTNRMAPLTAIAFFVLSIGLLGLIYTDKAGLEKRIAVLIPLLVTAIGLTVSFFCAHAFIIERDLVVSSDLDVGLILSMLFVGIILPLLTGSALWQREKIKVYSQELENKEQLFRRTVTAAQVGLWDWDLQNNRLVWAASSHVILASPDNASLPASEKEVLDLIPESDRDEVRKRVLESIETSEGFIVDYRTLRMDGQEIWVQSRGKVVETKNGEPIQLSGTLMDITDDKLKEIELKRSNQELEQFAYIASHDLKAPLRGVDNLAKWVIEDTEEILPADALEKLTLLRGRVARLEALLEDILTYSRAGRISDDPVEFDVGDLLVELGQTHLPENFKLVMENALPRIHSPRTPLAQIFGNILSNAVKHHDGQSGTISIRSQDMGSFYCFSVCDDGPGIPPEFHERAFQMFQTLQPRDKIDGSGIGMAIIKKLVEWRGGSVWITTNPQGRGTCINFLWPKTSRI